MNHLIIYTHLNPKSFSKSVVDRVETVSNERGHETRVIDLYGDKFNPVLEFPDVQYAYMGGEAPPDVAAYQAQVAWADHLTFVYPLWWEQMPAMLKGFIDRVFTNGFAFTYSEGGPQGLFGDKTVRLIINTGSSSEALQASGIQPAIQLAMEVGLFGFCAMKAETTFFGGAASGAPELLEGYLNSVPDLVP